MFSRAAKAARSDTRSLPPDFNGGIDEPTPRTDSYNVLHQLIVEEGEVSVFLNFVVYLARTFA